MLKRPRTTEAASAATGSSAAPASSSTHCRALNASLCAAGSAEALLQLASQQHASFNCVNLATLLQRLSRYPASARPALSSELSSALLARTAASLSEAPAQTGRTLTSLLHGLGSLGLGGRLSASLQSALQASVQLALQQRQGQQPADAALLSTLLWACGSLQGAEVEAGGSGSGSGSGSSSGSGSGSSSGSGSRGCCWQQQLFEAICAQACGRAASMSSAELASACWGLARSGLQPAAEQLALLSAAAAAAARRCSFSVQGLATVAWAQAKLRVRDAQLCSALCSCALTLLQRARQQAQQARQQAQQQAQQQQAQPHFGPQDISQLAWALGKLSAGAASLPSAGGAGAEAAGAAGAAAATLAKVQTELCRAAGRVLQQLSPSAAVSLLQSLGGAGLAGASASAAAAAAAPEREHRQLCAALLDKALAALLPAPVPAPASTGTPPLAGAGAQQVALQQSLRPDDLGLLCLHLVRSAC
jgi:hypothetical protein